MKKLMFAGLVLLTLCTVFIFTGCGKSTADNARDENSDENSDEFYLNGVGYSFSLPESLNLKNGFVSVSDYGDLDYNSGVMIGWPEYIDMAEEEYYALPDDSDFFPDIGYSFIVICVKDVNSEDAAHEKCIAVAEKTSNGLSEADKEYLRSFHMIHQENGYVWLSKTEERSTDINEACKAEYDAFYDATNEIISNMNFFTPEVFKSSDAGTAISFKTIDLDGNEVDSSALFAKNKVTMINIWATTCGPCINEMPELEELNKEFQQKGGAIVGLVDDVTADDTEFLDDALSIVQDTGVTYTNLRAWERYYDKLPVIVTPTTYFVDSDGELIGDPILGAQLSVYKEKMEEHLSKAEQ